jgi:putative DNA primase/helicase
MSIALIALIEPLARMFFGEPNKELSTKVELRFGTNGSISVNAQNGTWYDFERNEGGGVLDLIKREARFNSDRECFEYLKHKGLRTTGPSNGSDRRRSTVRSRKVVAEQYPYQNVDGALAFVVERFEFQLEDGAFVLTKAGKRKKSFRQKRPDPERPGAFLWNVDGVPAVPYRLPKLLKAIAAKRVVVVVEGERKADLLWSWNVPATCCSGGAKKWRAAHAKYLHAADVVILPDADDAGHEHVKTVAASLQGLAASVRVLELPGLGPKEDIVDWATKGGTVEQFNELIEQAKPWLPRHQQVATVKPAGKQDAIALEFARQHAESLRFVAAWNRWMQWDGARWHSEETLSAFDESRKLCREAGDADAKTVAAVISLARTDRVLAATSDQWDADTTSLGTPAGTISLSTGKMRPALPADYITKIAAVAPDGECRLWRQFLDRVTGGDTKLQSYLQRVCGYILTGNTREDAIFFMYGTGANGKSVFIRTIAGILGGYHRAAPIEMFTVSSGERHPTDLAMLRGARLVTATETEEGKRWDEAKIKALTGGDRIPARFMRQDFFEYTPQFKLLIAGNHRPSIRSIDEAFSRRMNVIPFTVTIPQAERDQQLSEKLKIEWPGILAWMVEGCSAWQQDGLRAPTAVVAATEDYLEAEDALRAWIDERCKCDPNSADTLASLWESWQAWAQNAGGYIGSKRKFGQKLEDKGFARSGTHGKARRHVGIRVAGNI